jgi:hypothetical protein
LAFLPTRPKTGASSYAGLRSSGCRHPLLPDVLSLDPGDQWQRELYRNIDGCDLFLLFWSASAKKSKWVRTEVRYALERKGRDEFAPPEIRPVIVAASAGCPAVAGGQHIHFGDWLRTSFRWKTGRIGGPRRSDHDARGTRDAFRPKL